MTVIEWSCLVLKPYPYYESEFHTSVRVVIDLSWFEGEYTFVSSYHQEIRVGYPFRGLYSLVRGLSPPFSAGSSLLAEALELWLYRWRC